MSLNLLTCIEPFPAGQLLMGFHMLRFQYN